MHLRLCLAQLLNKSLNFLNRGFDNPINDVEESAKGRVSTENIMSPVRSLNPK